jgi:hypothetical protein
MWRLIPQSNAGVESAYASSLLHYRARAQQALPRSKQSVPWLKEEYKAEFGKHR